MLEARAFKYHNRFPGISIFVEDIKGGSFAIAQPITMITMKKPNVYEPIQPTFQLNKHAAQKLMDDLWDCGLRPSEGSGSAGQLAATQRHLEDLRKLLSKIPLVKG